MMRPFDPSAPILVATDAGTARAATLGDVFPLDVPPDVAALPPGHFAWDGDPLHQRRIVVRLDGDTGTAEAVLFRLSTHPDLSDPQRVAALAAALALFERVKESA